MGLNQCQELATKEFTKFLGSDEKFFVITGSPGTGKSYLTSHLIKFIDKFNEAMKLINPKWYGYEVALTATTNKATQVIQEANPKFECCTIYSLLGLRVRKNFNTGKDFIASTRRSVVFPKSTIVFIDEASMVDESLMSHIKTYLKECKVIFIGDKDQLPSPNDEHMRPFTSGFKTAELVTPVRNTGAIYQLGQHIKECIHKGVLPTLTPNGKDIVHMYGKEFQNAVEDEFSLADIKKNPNHAKIIAWTNAKVIGYNSFVRSLYSSETYFQDGEMVLSNSPIEYANGAKLLTSTDEIICLQGIPEHNRDVVMGIHGHWYYVNGVQIFVPDDYQEVIGLKKEFARKKKWTEFYRLAYTFADVRPIHSCTCHKSQGSTYDKVYIDLDDIWKCRDINMVNRMLYVAITRAKSQVIFYGNLSK